MKFKTAKLKYNYFYSALAFCLLVTSGAVPLGLHYRILIMSLIILLSLFFAILGFKSDKMTIIGELEINEECISIYDNNGIMINKLFLEDLNEIILRYVAYKGTIPIGSVRTLIPSKGGNNYIIIKFKKGSFVIHIYLNDETDVMRFKKLYKFLIEQNINTKLKGF